MANPLFNMLSQGSHAPTNDMSQMIRALSGLKNSIQGNPKEQVEALMRSGAMSQNQFNQLQQAANQIYPLVKGRF